MLPFSSERYEQVRDYSLLIRMLERADLGPYTCQAYNGLGRAASWTITLIVVDDRNQSSSRTDDGKKFQLFVSHCTGIIVI